MCAALTFILLCVTLGACSAESAVTAAPPVLYVRLKTPDIESMLGHRGRAYERGITPTVLGWGSDESAYPQRFVVNPVDGAELVWIPAGEFDMGGTDGYREELPVHRVHITRGFWMYRHPVTNAQFRKFKPAHRTGSYNGAELDDDVQPVANVTWQEAQAYAWWANAGLPSEAQWEYAARAGTSTRFYWGDSETDAGKYANVADRAAKRLWPTWKIFDTEDGYAASSPVGVFLPNAFGLYDIIGNVWQWCADWYDAHYYKRSPAADPTGPADGRHRVIRGGSWDCFAAHSRASYRSWLILPSERYPWLGFRCVAP